MRSVPKGTSALAVALVLILLGGGIAVGQTAEPAWSGELLTDLEGWADAYNAQAEEVGFRGKSLIRGESVELHVRGEDGLEAVYSFRTDADTRIVDLQPGASEKVTLRLATERTVIDRIVADENPARALENALLSGRIGVKKVFHLLRWSIAVGPGEAAVGTVGLVAGAVVVAKVGLGGISAKFIALIKKFQVLLVEVYASLKVLARALEMFGVDLREKIRETVWRRLKELFRRRRESVPGPTPEDEYPADTEQAR